LAISEPGLFETPAIRVPAAGCAHITDIHQRRLVVSM
jgi:hypothetical protein